EMPAAALRRFLEAVKDRPDYPGHPKPDAAMDDATIRELARKVLKDRKGEAHGYAALLIAGCQAEAELPATIRAILDTIQETLSPPVVKEEAEVAAGRAAKAAAESVADAAGDGA